MTAVEIEAGGRAVSVSRADKVLFPDAGITKGELAEYYARVADTMLPQLRGRPLALERYPDGIEGEGFFQKDVPDYFPDWIERVEVERREGGTISQLVCGEPATLVYLADQGCITPHAWLSRTSALERPDRLVFDLDPAPGGELATLRAGGRAIASLLEELGLVPFLTTTGSRGFHVVAPLEPEAPFDEARELARGVARLVARREPEAFTTSPRTEKRRGRLFLDYLRNAYGQTAVAPYAVRARPGAAVATPVDRDELQGLEPDAYSIRNVLRRLGQKDDPWREIDRSRRSARAARRALDGLIAGADRDAESP